MFFKVKTPEEVLEILKDFDPVGTETISIGEALNPRCQQGNYLPGGYARLFQIFDGWLRPSGRRIPLAPPTVCGFSGTGGRSGHGLLPYRYCNAGKSGKDINRRMIPEGADAVVMVEYCHSVDEKTIEVSRTVAPLENIILKGDDFKEGSVIFKSGTVLRPQDIGVLAGLGIEKIAVHRKPKVAIISTGDEVIPIDERPAPGQVRDINSYTLSAFAPRPEQFRSTWACAKMTLPN